MRSYEEWFEDQIKIDYLPVTKERAWWIMITISFDMYNLIVKSYYFNYDNSEDIKIINEWLHKCQTIEIPTKAKRITAKGYYKWLYDEFHGSQSQLEMSIKFLNKYYDNLSITEISVNKLFKKLKHIYVILSKDLSSNNFKSIEDYIR